MKLRYKLIIIFSVVFVYILALILAPVIGKKTQKKPHYFFKVDYSEKNADYEHFRGSDYNSFTMYVDYNSNDIDYYKKYKGFDFEIYLSIYSITDLDNYDSKLFDGIFIKDIEHKDEIMDKTNDLKGKRRLLTDDINDYDKYKNKVEKFIVTHDIVIDIAKKYPNVLFYEYMETTLENLQSSYLNYLKERREARIDYGLLIYAIN